MPVESSTITRSGARAPRLARVLAGIIFSFAGNLVKVFALQVLNLIADDIDLLVYIIAGPRRGIDNLSSILMRIFCKF